MNISTNYQPNIVSIDPISLDTKIALLVSSYYSEPHRAYHTLKHLDMMFSGYEDIFGEITVYEAIAIWYHDIVYSPWSKTNEEDSIKMLKLHHSLFFNYVPLEVIEKASSIILDTKHNKQPELDSFKVIDLDLMILGSDEETYSEYVKNTRLEFCIFSDEEWKIGRGKFLNHMLSKPIYNTAEIRMEYELQAYNNMEKELLTLK